MLLNSDNLREIDLGTLDTSNWSLANRMFKGCDDLETIIFKATESWRLLSLEEMFSGCTRIKNVDLQDIVPDGSSISNMEYMFLNCYSIEDLDLSTFNIDIGAETTRAFLGCSRLFEVMDYIGMPINEQSVELIMSQLLDDDNSSNSV